MFLSWTGEVLQQGVQTPTRDSHQPGPSQKREHIARPCLRLRRGFVSTLLSLRCACSSCRSTRRVIFVEFSWDRVSVSSRRMSSHGNRGCISLSKKFMSWRCKKGTYDSLSVRVLVHDASVDVLTTTALLFCSCACGPKGPRRVMPVSYVVPRTRIRYQRYIPDTAAAALQNLPYGSHNNITV